MILLTDSISQSSNFCVIVLDETTYYITAFAVDSNNAVIGTQQTTITTSFGWHPSANTLAYRSLNGNTTDGSGNGHNGTIGGSVGFTTQGSRSVAIINGTPSGIETGGSFMNGIGTGDFTISIWMNLSGNTGNSDQVMFAFWKEEEPRPGFSLRLQNNNYIKFCVGNWSSSGLTVSNASSYYGGWHNFILTRKNGVVYCYIDKILKGSFNYSSAITGIDNGWILSRNNTNQYMKLGTKGAEYIVEKISWDSSFISKYYNHSKTQFGL